MPAHSQADQISELSKLVAQLFRMAWPNVPAERRAEAAAAAGMSAELAADFQAGLVALPPWQGIAYCGYIAERKRTADGSYATQLRQPHAGSDIMGGPQEHDLAAVDANVAKLSADFSDWTVERPDGWKSLTDPGGASRLVWKAARGDDAWPDVFAKTAAELRVKLMRVEAELAHQADQMKRFMDGRGAQRTKVIR